MAHQARGDETRERILAAATDCFTRAGYDATGVAEICQRAGVSKGAFYHHFSSKQAVFVTLVDQWLAWVDEPVRTLRGTGENVPERLLSLAGMVQQVFEFGAGHLPMFLEFWRQAVREPQIWQTAIEPYRHYRQAFAEIIAQGIAAGSLRPVDPQVAAQALVSLGVGLVLQGALDPDGADWGRTAEEAITMWLERLLNLSSWELTGASPSPSGGGRLAGAGALSAPGGGTARVERSAHGAQTGRR